MPFKVWPTGTPLKMDPAATKEAASKKASSAAGKFDPSSSAEGALCFWSSSTNCMRLRFGMMIPNLLDLATITGLLPRGDDFSATNLPEAKVGLDFHKSNKTCGSWVKMYRGYGGEPTDPPSINGVSYTEHVAFLVMWLCKFLACAKFGWITKEFEALAEVLADGHQVAMGPIFLAYLYRGLRELTTKPMDYHASGAIWIFQLWL
ncbi:hypothetical protein L3X38_042362 [Prunus dulcis]|uniref:Aminotransferase-like plant mobile domain-containing protein n=1 Tax=Prunus dulcis TaxID=3755 RepID=A0AAD4UV15_PRUDU|nr:hypothetical protein L3X38_042362 [Prunus dulcis]